MPSVLVMWLVLMALSSLLVSSTRLQIINLVINLEVMGSAVLFEMRNEGRSLPSVLSHVPLATCMCASDVQRKCLLPGLSAVSHVCAAQQAETVTPVCCP